ncbi:hypothetical protein N1028_01765 [Herbiconiux sp. CPCC 203407]|uniref:Uncharacterized protein n=1 Tax=Herbiconiux oxytropis TaxID=2970915 RepID=A0AA41XF83_9MICO|nr:hypothetical protein [Herbiconiux oxytropis]MCS5721538.1 hypothetical protein [Herbiconiux oxytropis]MCS5724615.1 hypothetical protein [Herbiconiux oxytropis]
MSIDPQRRDAIRELLLKNAQQPAAQPRRRRGGIVASTLLVAAVTVGVVAVVASALPLSDTMLAASDPPVPTMESSPLASGVQIDCASGRDPGGPWERGILAVRAGEVVDRDQVPFSSTPTEPVVDREPLVAHAERPPVGAVLCFEIWDVDEGFVRFAQQEYRGDLAALVSALTGPNTQPRAGDCTSVWRSQPNLWIVLSDGSTVAPRWPTDGCGDLVGDPAEGLLDPANVPDPTP